MRSAVFVLLASCWSVARAGTSAAAAASVGFSASSGPVFNGTKVRTWRGDRGVDTASVRPIGPPPPPSPQATATCDSWVVITTIFAPTPTVREASKLPGWCVVVVADLKSPSSYDADVHYLTPDMQSKLPFESAALLPWNHFGRKNIGYLYALWHGARRIYDTDDDNEISSSELLLSSERRASAAEYANVFASTYNVYLSFEPSEPRPWPRGIPLTSIKDSRPAPATAAAAAAAAARACVVQSLANDDPDVDAIYRLTRDLPLRFGRQEACVLVPRWTYSPFNAQATMFEAADVAWFMLLPVTVSGRVSDIWRSYVLQSALQNTDSTCQLAFCGPWVRQLRNPHAYMGDFAAELDLYAKADALVRVLQASKRARARARAPHAVVGGVYVDVGFCVRPPARPARRAPWRMQTRPGCDAADAAALLVCVYVDLYERDFVQEADVELARAWGRDLVSLGLRPPGVSARASPPRKAYAVVISGQPRTLVRAIGNIRSEFLRRLVGGYDVFMFIQSNGAEHEPAVGDTGFCGEFFTPSNEVNVRCAVVREEPLRTSALEDIWPSFHYHNDPNRHQGFLQQIYGMAEADRMRETYTFETGQARDAGCVFVWVSWRTNLTFRPASARRRTTTSCGSGRTTTFTRLSPKTGFPSTHPRAPFGTATPRSSVAGTKTFSTLERPTTCEFL